MLAPIVRVEGETSYVLCPRCSHIHRHGNVKPGDVRGSDCLNIGLCGDYEIGGLMDIRTLEWALRRRESENRRKRAARVTPADIGAALGELRGAGESGRVE